MKKLLGIFALMLFASSLPAQDYYLTNDKNKSPLKVAAFSDINDLLKSSKKQDKYQVVFLDISQNEAIFALIPATFKQEMSEDGLMIYDRASTDFGLETLVTKSDNVKIEVDTFKADIAGDSKLLQENILDLNGKALYELIFDMQDGTIADAYFLGFKGKAIQMVFGAQKTDMPKYSAAVKNIISSIGFAVISTGEAAPRQEPVDAVLVNFSALPAISASKKLTEVQFMIGDKIFNFEVASNIITTQENGRIIFQAPIKGHTAFFMEVPGAKSKEYYNSILAGFEQGRKLRASPVQNIKVGDINVRLMKKAALNMSADNYFFTKEGVPFVISFIAGSKDQPYFDKTAKGIISGLRVLNAVPAEVTVNTKK